jgi:hypothetical protein
MHSLKRRKDIVAVRALVSIAACAALATIVAACGGRLGNAIPDIASQFSNQSQPGSHSTGNGRRVVTGFDLAGRSADGTYQIRTLHANGLKVHQSIATVTAAGTFTQVEYKTPYGMLKIVQSPKTKSTILKAQETANSSTVKAPTGASVAASSKLSATGGTFEVQTIGSGTTSNGATWIAYIDPSGYAYDVHVEFADSAINAMIPRSTPVELIKSTVEDLY